MPNLHIKWFAARLSDERIIELLRHSLVVITKEAGLFYVFLQPVKTYTRRGRGRCLNPGCTFVYVTRHKPPTCPQCGNHLGGKWIPAVSE